LAGAKNNVEDAFLTRVGVKARRFKKAMVQSDGVPFAAVAKREGVSRIRQKPRAGV
jgi:hypothetical protein